MNGSQDGYPTIPFHESRSHSAIHTHISQSRFFLRNPRTQFFQVVVS
jgi:hypothetical protein